MLADTILVAHFAFVTFVVGGLLAIWVGAAAGWRWIRGFGFRIAHLAAILFVAGESLAGAACPLTVWEAALRGDAPDRSFLARWLHEALYWDLPESVFTYAYVTFALVVAATCWLVPPERQGGAAAPP